MESRLGILRLLGTFLSISALFVQAGFGEWKETRVLGAAGFQHAGTIAEVFALPDGKQVVTACDDGSARLWEVESGKELQRYAREDSKTIWSVRLLARGEQLLTAGDDGFITRWETATGKKLMSYEQGKTVFRLAVRPGEKEFVAVDADNNAVLWNVKMGEKVRTFEGHSKAVYAAVFLSAGEKLLTGGSDEKLKLWNVATGKCEKTLEDDFDNIYTLALSPDKKSVAMCTSNNRVLLLDAETLEEKWSDKIEDGVKVVSWSPDGQKIVGASSDDLILFWSAKSGQVTKRIELPDASHRGLGYSWDGHEVFVGCGGVLARYACDAGSRVMPTLGLPVFSEGVEEVVMASSVNVVYASNNEEKVQGWDTETGKSLGGIAVSESIQSIAISPDDNYLAFGLEDGEVEMFERESGRAIRTFAGDGRGKKDFDGRVQALAFNGDGTVIVAGSSRNQMLSWDVSDGRILQGFLGHEDDINDLLIAPNGGDTLMSASDDKTVRMWSLKRGIEMKKLNWGNERVGAIVALEQGRSFLATSFDRELRGSLAKEEEGVVVLSPAEFKELIKALGAEAYADRKAASDELIMQGNAAIAHLEAVRPHDPEIVFRIREIKGKIRRGNLGDEMKELYSFAESVNDLAADGEGKQWAVTIGDGVFSQIVIGRVENRELVIDQTLSSHRGAEVLAFSLDGKSLSVGNNDGTVSIFAWE